jgi:voltage-gated potassium channel
MGSITVKGHVVICGWNERGYNIIQQLHQDVIKDKKPILIVSEDISGIVFTDDDVYNNVYIVNGDPSNAKILRRANIADADTAIILSESKEIASADVKCLTIALAIESLNARVHTVVELMDPNNKEHFQRAGVDEVIAASEITEKLLAQGAVTHGISKVFLNLLTYSEQTNEVYKLPLPESWDQLSFGQLLNHLIEHQVILVGVTRVEAPEAETKQLKLEEEFIINPGSDYQLRRGDNILVVAFSEPDVETLLSEVPK